MTRPEAKNHMKSFVVQWKGNTPHLQQSTWAPGYTPGHQNTEQEAIAAEIVQLMQHIADFREKWLALNLLAEQHNTPTQADSFGSPVSVTVTDDPHEEMTMPEGAVSVLETTPLTHQHNYWIDEGDDLRSKPCMCKIGGDHTDANPWADYDDHQDH